MLSDADIDIFSYKVRGRLLIMRNSSEIGKILSSMFTLGWGVESALKLDSPLRAALWHGLRDWMPSIGWHDDDNRTVCHMGWLPHTKLMRPAFLNKLVMAPSSLSRKLGCTEHVCVFKLITMRGKFEEILYGMTYFIKEALHDMG